MDIQRLKDLREDRDLFQEDIAKVLNISQSHYSLYERGIRSMPIELLNKLADYYNVSVDYLIGRTNTKEMYPKKKDV